jgi:Uma2 family endonuclease
MTTAIQSIPLQIARNQRNYTLEEYLLKEAKSVEKHEFINGKIVKMPYAKGPHNIISANMTAEFILAFRQKETNYCVFGSDQKIFFPSLNEGVYADCLAVSEVPQYWDNKELLLLNPLIIVEVLSDSTAAYDRKGKFNKYKTLDSFKEYVMIRQDKCYAEVWYRERPGLWHETIIEDINAKIPLQSVDIEIDMKMIYHNTKVVLK